ncbi:flagellar assembly protein FliW [Paenibacillus sp. FSL H8-0548]|uniref:flagellar assembly protein FliW n=1 Tax=Paenibacillus sp. FSL H8-0548 TaxID=1920422 RepID=UPI0009FB1ADF|nr:flagellar assembly protein FliW [Paenibacillus sp. FSL H8-0548]
MMTEQNIHFKYGIPGFENLQQFVMTEVEGDLPMKLLKPVNHNEISFLIASPFYFRADYEWDLPQSVMDELEIADETDVEIWSILTIPADPKEATLNLLAPLVFNKTKRLGKQHIIHNSSFSARAPLFEVSIGSSLQGGA